MFLKTAAAFPVKLPVAFASRWFVFTLLAAQWVWLYGTSLARGAVCDGFLLILHNKCKGCPKIPFTLFLRLIIHKLYVMIFRKGFTLYKIVFVALCVMLSSLASAQIGFKGGVYKSFLTEYNSSFNEDSTFILNYFKTAGKLTRDTKVDSLKVSSGHTGLTHFAWFALDANAKPLLNDTLSKTDALHVIKQGGYQVSMRGAGWDTTCLAWVFFADTLSVKIDKTADGKVKEFSCSSFLLKSNVTVNTFTYADPESGAAKVFDEAKLRTIAWSPTGMTDPTKASTRVVSLYKPSIKTTTYTITVKHLFGTVLTDNVTYESVIPEAKFKFQFRKLEKKDAVITEDWSDYSESDSLSALVYVKFQNNSTNAQKYTWVLSDTLLGKYTPLPVKIDTSMLAFEPEYTYYLPRTYRPMLIAINTKLGCRDTVVYNPADEDGTKDYKVKVANSILDEGETMPNVFTPNGDGNNDYFRPRLQSIKSFHLYVYNRQGTKLYEYDHDENKPVSLWPGWDGKLSSGNLIKPGVYFYVMQARGWDGVGYRTKRYSGTLSVFY